jgi:hypothetical protein
MLGKVCLSCQKRFFRGGGVVRFRHADLEEGDYAEAPVCEKCSQDLERIAAVGESMADYVNKEMKDQGINTEDR